MIDLAKQLLADHFVLIFSTLIAFVALMLGLAVKLFHELRTDPTTKKALKEEARFIRAMVGMFRPSVLPKAGEPDPLAETSMRERVPDPRTSGEKKP